MREVGTGSSPSSGSRTLKDATNEAMREWMSSVEDTHYIIGSVVGPHPFPAMVRDFQSVIGTETKRQCLEQVGKLPDAIVACVGGGSNAAGIFHPFVEDRAVDLVGVEAGGRGPALGQHAATLNNRAAYSRGFGCILQDDDGADRRVHSVSAGLDYQALARAQPGATRAAFAIAA